MAATVILVEASPRRAADGVTETVRIAGGGGRHPYFYGGQHWRAGIVQLPTFITAINFEGGDFGEGGVPQATELQWAATSKADLSALSAYFWIDAVITVRIGPENAEGTLPPVALTGKVLSGLVDGGALKIQLTDPAADLKKPLLTARYAGTGGLEGPVDFAGKIKDRVWGRVWNKAGEPIDKANNIYVFADPLRPLQAFDLVRDKGAPAASLTFLAWQGSAAATLAALQAAVAPAGGGVVCPSIACVKWWTQPAGDLTADLRGEIGAGYVETTAEIVQRIVSAGPGTAFAAGTIAAALAARPAPAGWVAKDDNTTVAATIEELLGNSSLLWLMNAAGEIVLREWAWGAPAATATSHAVKRTAMFRPVATRTIGYQRNEKQMARGDLAGVVLWGDVTGLAKPGSNLVYDGGLRLGGARWTKDAGWSVFLTGDVGWCAGISGPVSSAKGFYSDYFKVNGSTVYSLTLDWGGGGTVSFFGYINWYNSSFGYISSSSSISPTMGVGFVRDTLTATSPSGAAFGQIILLATSISSGGQVLVKKIKCEVGSIISPFNDDATNGAAYANGLHIDALKPGELGANVTETRTAGAIAGQTAWATYAEFTPTGVAKPGSNLVYDGGLSLGGARWTKDAGWSVFLTGDVGWCAGISGPVSSGKSFYADYFGVYGSGSYTVSLDWGGSGTVSAFAYVNWYNSSYGYISSSASISPATGVGFVRDKFTVTSPSGAAFGIIVLLVTSITAGGQLLVKKIKCETGATATPFNDDATNGAAYANGLHIDALKPGEIGANVTETRIAGGIAGQGALATLSTIGTTQMNANTVSEFTVTPASNPTFSSGTTPTVLSYTLSKPSEAYLVRVTVAGTMRILGTSGTPTTNLQIYGRVNNGATVFGRQDVNENVSGTTIFRQFNFTKSYPAASLTNGQAIEIYASLGATGGTYDVQFLYTEITVEFFKR